MQNPLNRLQPTRVAENRRKVQFILLKLTIFTVLVATVLAIWKIPQQQVGTDPLQVDEKARIDAETDARVALVQGIGGLLLFTTAGISWLNLRATQRNVLIAEEKQVTERFSKAVEMLGNENNIHIRLGGIYALERIAKDSPKDHWQIMEIFTAFIREKARLEHNQQPFKIINHLSEQYEEDENCYDDPCKNYDHEPWDGISRTPTEGYIHPVAVDLQAVLTALGRRTQIDRNGVQNTLDLSRTDLRGVVLTGDLAGVNLEEANLQWATLKEVNLSRSILNKANLEIAKFQGAILEGAELKGAELKWTKFSNTNFQGADLTKANLDETEFQTSDLANATLKYASLRRAEIITPCSFERADLEGAKLNGAKLSQINFKGATLRAANLNAADLQNSDLKDAKMESASLIDANLENVSLSGACLNDAKLSDANFHQTDFHQVKLCGTRLAGVDLSSSLNLTSDQVKTAKLWEEANYSAKLRQELSLPPSTTDE